MRILVAVLAALLSMSAQAGNTYTFTLVRVIDGDTFRADVPIWPRLSYLVDIRVAGVDTPEPRSPLVCERALAAKATAFTAAWLAAHPGAELRGIKEDKYSGRFNASVMDGALSLAGALLASGHARPYDGAGQRPVWCED